MAPARRASRPAAPARPPTLAERPPRFATDAVPLYYQLGSVLREKILSGQFATGDRLPTEAELSQEYGVSRITVRQALAAIEEEGLIRREAGRGTFVSEHPSFTGALKVEGSLDDLISLGLATSVQLLDLRTVKASPAQAGKLQLEPDAPLTRCTRLRFHHEEPYSYIVNLLPQEIGRRIKRSEWRKGTILKVLERLGYASADADQTVQASLADANLARLLKTRIGAPLLSVDRVVRSGDGRPVELVHTYYRSDIYCLNVHLVHRVDQTSRERVWSLRQPRKR